jgi:FixJ family two-component response regulator
MENRMSINQGFGRPRKNVALVDGDPTVRRARQLLLRSEHYEVLSYASCAALLAEPQAHNDACIVVDVGMRDGDGLAFLRAMRTSGWHGRAILLDGVDQDGALAREAGRNGDMVFAASISDRSLLAAIAGSFH